MEDGGLAGPGGQWREKISPFEQHKTGQRTIKKKRRGLIFVQTFNNWRMIDDDS